MRAYVRLLHPDGTEYELSSGDIIGRLWSAALPLDDAAVSEAHAMVSLRGDELKLLSLRGMFSLGAKPISELVLEEGQRIWFSRELFLEVIRVERPSEVLAIEGEGLGRQVLTGVCTLVTQPRPQLLPRAEDAKAARIWTNGAAWRIRLPGGEARDLRPGDRVELDGQVFHAVAVSLESAARPATRAALYGSLKIIGNFDTVHLHRKEGGPVSLSGIQGRIVCELISLGGAVAWDVVAAEIWPDEVDRASLRRKWDVNLARLRANLREQRIRPDLVRADGTGNFELFLYPDDQIEDRA